MATGVNIKMGVTGISQFKQDMATAKQQITTMNADLALLEKQYKATGDAETYLKTKTELLKAKLEEQKIVLKAAEDALDAMKKNGVTPATAAFQVMQQKVIAAKSDLIDTETQLKNVETAGAGAGTGVGDMNDQLKNIGKGVSWENVTNGIGKVTDALEKGVKAAIRLGKKIADSARDSTEWADEVLTDATKYGTDAETIQRMRNVADLIDTDVDTIMKARQKLAKNSGKLSEELGIEADGMTLDEMFWAAGEAIRAMTDDVEQENAAQAIFGKGWKDLLPLFTAGQEEYNRLIEEQDVVSNERVKTLGEADDALKKIDQQMELLKREFWAENADKIVELAQWVLDNKDGLIAAITAIGGAIATLKLAETALNIKKVVDGAKNLLGAAGGGAAGGAGGAGAAGAGGDPGDPDGHGEPVGSPEGAAADDAAGIYGQRQLRMERAAAAVGRR